MKKMHNSDLAPWVCTVWRGRLKVYLSKLMMKIEFKKNIVASSFIMEIKGHHIRISSSSNSPIKKSYDGYKVGRNLCMA